MRKKAEEIFLAGVESVLPEKLIQTRIKRSGDVLQIAGKSYLLSGFRHIYVLAAGKAAALMAKETERILGDKITGGHVVTKYGHETNLKYLKLTEAGHPIPDAEGVKGTRKMLDIARQSGEDDLVVCLISGGASALMADFPEGTTLDDLRYANELLVKCGADITEINAVRKHLSNVKGGQLAKMLYPATTVCLILSDVTGGRLDVIASGPTLGDASTFADAWAVIKKYSLENSFPSPMLNHLKKGLTGLIPETPKPDDAIFRNVQNYIIGNNLLALEGASRKAQELGFKTHIVTDKLKGDYTNVADFILKTIENYQQATGKKPVCLLFGGEPTVKVSGNGSGGRNQHLALYLSTKIDHEKHITILCAGTDGTDGPTDAAGAVVDNETIATAVKKNIDPRIFLQNSDSYRFFQQTGGHIITGNTRTNVMDMVVVVMEASPLPQFFHLFKRFTFGFRHHLPYE
ncbi:glycerate kinase [uncultured Proteiniphilum sp.]|uniref:glycerate kinase type-2 family protein n=1 Tax=uncultured Proteiniphilum sp. TaxID=497637 RepID=UPI0026391883|nr:glycerate kinase [uncultured Proteiniphilum sp.]